MDNHSLNCNQNQGHTSIFSLIVKFDINSRQIVPQFPKLSHTINMANELVNDNMHTLVADL